MLCRSFIRSLKTTKRLNKFAKINIDYHLFVLIFINKIKALVASLARTLGGKIIQKYFSRHHVSFSQLLGVSASTTTGSNAAASSSSTTTATATSTSTSSFKVNVTSNSNYEVLNLVCLGCWWKRGLHNCCKCYCFNVLVCFFFSYFLKDCLVKRYKKIIKILSNNNLHCFLKAKICWWRSIVDLQTALFDGEVWNFCLILSFVGFSHTLYIRYSATSVNPNWSISFFKLQQFHHSRSHFEF